MIRKFKYYNFWIKTYWETLFVLGASAEGLQTLRWTSKDQLLLKLKMLNICKKMFSIFHYYGNITLMRVS
jgi:hypothetical protein